MKKRVVFALLMLVLLTILLGCSPKESLNNEYALMLSIEGEGRVSPGIGLYPKGTIIVFDIRPETGWKFKAWEGDGSYELNLNQGNGHLLMDRDKKLTAVFIQDLAHDEPKEPTKNYNLQVTTMGKGSVSPDHGIFEEGKMINLELCPEAGWTFETWAGPDKNDLDGSHNQYSIAMDKDRYLIAVFQENRYDLNVTIEGNGSVKERIIQNNYPQNSIIRLIALADYGWAFKEWQGDAKGSDISFDITMDSDKKVKAVFEQISKKYTLDINVIGKGQVEEKLIGAEYESNSKVELTAIPDSNWQFKEWTGSESSKQDKLVIEMDQDKTITAEFEEIKPIEYSLNVIIAGEGQVKIAPNRDKFLAGEIVVLEALANSGWAFEGWQGDITKNNSEIEVMMDNDKKIIACFLEKDEEEHYALDIAIVGNGTVSKSPDLPFYPKDTTVIVTANPAEGWEFIEWSGNDFAGKDQEKIILMNKDIQGTAYFQEKQEKTFKIKVKCSPPIAGYVSKNPDQEEYLPGTVVTLTAISKGSYKLAYWVLNGKIYPPDAFTFPIDEDIDAVAYFAYDNCGD